MLGVRGCWGSMGWGWCGSRGGWGSRGEWRQGVVRSRGWWGQGVVGV